MTRRTTIATTYGTEIARLAERIDASPDLCVAIIESDPPSTQSPVTLATRPIVIGHSRDCDIPLDDPRVSDRHAEVVRDGGAIRVRDLGSTNGILIHGALVRDAIVGIGQVFVVGKTALRVQPKRRPAEVAPSQATRFGELVGQSLPMRELFAVLEDLPLLVAEILRRRGFADDTHIPLDPNVLAMLRSHHWPGNVRELRNTLERALALSPHARSAADLKLRLTPDISEIEGFDIAFDQPWAVTRDRIVGLAERRYFAELVRRYPDNLSAQARAAGIDRKTLRNLLERHGLARPE